MICVVCNHKHKPGEQCRLCHCASGVEKHPQDKKPYAERYDPAREFPRTPAAEKELVEKLEEDESGVEKEEDEE